MDRGEGISPACFTPPPGACTPRQRGIELLADLQEWNLNRFAERTELDDVEPTLTTFAFADPGLGLLEPLGEIDLSEASGLPGIDEEAEEDPIVLREDRLLHPSSWQWQAARD